MTRITVGESKSMANRLLILASYGNEPLPNFSTQAKDVLELRHCLDLFLNGSDKFEVSEGGTTFRFLLARVSRKPGVYKIYASERLLSRPQEPLYAALKQLGVHINKAVDHVEIKTDGWKPVDKEVNIDCALSTQFASALLLNSKNLPFAINWNLENLENSLPYWLMTEDLVRANSLPPCEIDLSSAFSVAALGLMRQGVIIQNFPQKSNQADFRFVEILKNMGAQAQADNGELKIFPVTKLKSTQVDLSHSPDLLPVLSALCALAEGESVLKNISHIKVKESDRVAKSIELIENSGGEAVERNGCLYIKGPLKKIKDSFSFDPDQDHRMAMAAGVLQLSGVSIKIENPHVVEKSFPDFWQVLEALK